MITCRIINDSVSLTLPLLGKELCPPTMQNGILAKGHHTPIDTH